MVDHIATLTKISHFMRFDETTDLAPALVSYRVLVINRIINLIFGK
jgi:hypothetical protein